MTSDSDKPAEDPATAAEEARMAERRADLARRLDAARARREPPPSMTAPRGGLSGMAAGLRIASEFIAGVVVGALIGYGIDHFFGTRPFGLIVFLLFGFAAGVSNVIRSAAKDKNSPDSDQEEGRN